MGYTRDCGHLFNLGVAASLQRPNVDSSRCTRGYKAVTSKLKSGYGYFDLLSRCDAMYFAMVQLGCPNLAFPREVLQSVERLEVLQTSCIASNRRRLQDMITREFPL